MKKAITQIVSLIIENETQQKYEWNELFLKLGVLSISVYCMIYIDVLVYGYLTR